MLRWLHSVLGLDQVADAGTRGEQHATDWLRRTRGFAIVARNWRNPRDRGEELDLVCRDGEVLMFVEVKARAPGALVPGDHAIDRRKKRVLRRAIDAYLNRLVPAPRTFRFDAVEIAFSADIAEPEIRHFENIPLFPKHYRG